MSIFKTYKEAVLANGSTKGVMFARNCLTGEEFFRSRVDFDYELQCPNLDGAFWLECNPADHLESLESFLTSGKRLASGDLITYLNGSVKSVENPKIMNTCADSQNQRYVLQAAADQVETPKKKEAFDAMTYAAPQQFESLSSSEKPNNSEWNGKGLPPVGVECEFKYKDIEMEFKFGKIDFIGDKLIVINTGYEQCYHIESLELRKPETPEQRAERERLEAAYYLYCKCGIQHETVSFEKFKAGDDCYPCVWLDIVNETGYRKEDK